LECVEVLAALLTRILVSWHQKSLAVCLKDVAIQLEADGVVSSSFKRWQSLGLSVLQINIMNFFRQPVGKGSKHVTGSQSFSAARVFYLDWRNVSGAKSPCYSPIPDPAGRRAGRACADIF
jgi:hypothetical protein